MPRKEEEEEKEKVLFLNTLVSPCKAPRLKLHPYAYHTDWSAFKRLPLAPCWCDGAGSDRIKSIPFPARFQPEINQRLSLTLHNYIGHCIAVLPSLILTAGNPIQVRSYRVDINFCTSGSITSTHTDESNEM